MELSTAATNGEIYIMLVIINTYKLYIDDRKEPFFILHELSLTIEDIDTILGGSIMSSKAS